MSEFSNFKYCVFLFGAINGFAHDHDQLTLKEDEINHFPEVYFIYM